MSGQASSSVALVRPISVPRSLKKLEADEAVGWRRVLEADSGLCRSPDYVLWSLRKADAWRSRREVGESFTRCVVYFMLLI